MGGFAFRCFTRHGAASGPRPGAAGLESASREAKERWAADSWCQAPYQYEESNMVKSGKGNLRRLVAAEEELISGMPRNLTLALAGAKLPSDEQERVDLERRRKSLIGDAWHFSVTKFILMALFMSFDSSRAVAGATACPESDPWATSEKWARVDVEDWRPVFRCRRRDCGFVNYLNELDRETGFVPPGRQDLHAARASEPAVAEQSRTATAPAGWCKRVPSGLPPSCMPYARTRRPLRFTKGTRWPTTPGTAATPWSAARRPSGAGGHCEH